MKTKFTITLAALALAALAAEPKREISISFSQPLAEVQQITNTVQQTGQFWVQWVLETNDTPRRTMENFGSGVVWMGTNFLTEAMSGTITLDNDWEYRNGFYQPKQKLESNEGTITKYVSSNLVAFLVWCGKTNVNYLESVPVTNLTFKWKIKKETVWE